MLDHHHLIDPMMHLPTDDDSGSEVDEDSDEDYSTPVRPKLGRQLENQLGNSDPSLSYVSHEFEPRRSMQHQPQIHHSR